MDIGSCEVILHQQGGESLLRVLQIEEHTQSRLTDIKTAEDDFLTQERKTHRHIGGIEGLALTRGGRGEEDGLLSLSHHELDIGTQATEDLIDLIVAVLMHHDTACGLGTLVGHCHICHNRQGGELRQFIMALDAIAEQSDEEEDAIRNGNAQYYRHQKDNDSFRADLATILGILNDLTLISRGCQRDAVLLALLQQEQIQA